MTDLKKPLEGEKQTPKPIKEMRTLILETDGTNVNMAKCEWTNLELSAGLSMILNKLNNN